MHVVESGLIIDPEFSHLGSSPDRIRVCQCCGKRVVEVKRSLMPHIAAVEYIYKENGTYRFKKETKWNYQIQGEKAFSEVTNADLVIYTNKGILIVEVLFDKYLWEEMLVKLNKFYSKHVISEILTQRINKLLS